MLLRFKKSNKRGVGANILTQETLDFIDPNLTFDFLEDIYKVEATYKLDELGTGFEELAIIERDIANRIWAIYLNYKPDAEIIEFPVAPAPIPLPPEVLPKDRKKDSDDESFNN